MCVRVYVYVVFVLCVCMCVCVHAHVCVGKDQREGGWRGVGEVPLTVCVLLHEWACGRVSAQVHNLPVCFSL